MEHNTLQGVIFDLDGTLLDSTGMWRQVDGRLMAHYGKEVPPDLSETVQRMSIEEFSQFFVEEFDLPVTPEQIAQQVADMVAEEYREEAALRRLHVWERLRFLLTEQNAGAPKTQPRIFQLAAQKLHLGRRQIAVVEDSLHALEGAKNGGFFTIGIADPENAPVWKEICATATVHIHDILEMKQFF